MIVGVTRQNTTVVRATQTNLFLFSVGLYINRLRLGFTCVVVQRQDVYNQTSSHSIAKVTIRVGGSIIGLHAPRVEVGEASASRFMIPSRFRPSSASVFHQWVDRHPCTNTARGTRPSFLTVRSLRTGLVFPCTSICDLL